MVVVGKGASICSCRAGQAIQAKRTAISRELPVNAVPRMFERFTIESMLPMVNRHEKQVELLRRLKENPRASVVMYGRNSFGAGKSAIGWGLYNSALQARRQVAGGKLASFVRMMQDWEVNAKEPIVRPSDLRLWDGGLLWLDEFGKVKPSEFAIRQVFDFIDVAYEEEQQIVVATNLSRGELKDYWDSQSDQYGEAIRRRLFDRDDVIAVNFGDQE
jgi:DNA replication protein DnaC